ncbi:MAG: hypothetical protein RKO66_15115 [Candidatus Contendobacter sp.]|nr:hypothetical protein [Candidatus Contendobacter sp.]MDS4060703.1 hypothetical protein [Candidatus Contendobacter sp.]
MAVTFPDKVRLEISKRRADKKSFFKSVICVGCSKGGTRFRTGQRRDCWKTDKKIDGF